jgi:tetratricopeptide (TPR) repeat protein
VIARNSSFAYKGRSVDVREVGRELGVGYVLEGSVRRSVDRLRITAQLIETNAGGHLWADRFDGKLADVFELQDRIAESAAAVIEPRMRFAEVEREKRKPTHSMHAYDLWLRALSAAREFTAASMESALDCLDRALAIDSAYALALATSAYYRAHCHMQGWRREPDDIQARDVRRAWDAVELAKDDANVLWMSAFAIWTLARDAPRAAELFRRSLALNPNSAIALTMAGWLEATNGNAAGGRKMIERSQRLNPNHPTPWLMSTGMAIACIAEGKFQEAIPWAEKALLHNRRFAVALRALAVALVHSGRIERARAIVQELVALEPGLTVSAIRTRLPHVFEPILNAYTDALGKAGLPE